MGEPLESLLAELKDPNAEVRRSAVLRAPEAFPNNSAACSAVLAALTDPVWCVREVAAASAGRFADADGSIHASLVALTLRDSSPHVRLAAAITIGPRIRPERDYGPAVRHHFERQRIRAAAALGHVASPFAGYAVSLLALCVADAHPKVRFAALRSLARLEPLAVLPLLPVIVRKCAEADADIAGAALEVWARALADAAAELLRPLHSYPGTDNVLGAQQTIEQLPTTHVLRRVWESMPPPAEASPTPRWFAKHLAAVCERVLTEFARSTA